MSKLNVEFKKWNKIYLPSEDRSAGVKSDHVLTGNLFCAQSVVRSVQLSVAVLFAGGGYLLNLWIGEGVLLLAVLAATSAFVYIGLATQSRTGALALLNLFAVPIVFATAYAGMNVSTEWLSVSFILHGSVTAVQLSSIDKDLSIGLFFWSAFNCAIALFLLLG